MTKRLVRYFLFSFSISPLTDFHPKDLHKLLQYLCKLHVPPILPHFLLFGVLYVSFCYWQWRDWSWFAEKFSIHSFSWHLAVVSGTAWRVPSTSKGRKNDEPEKVNDLWWRGDPCEAVSVDEERGRAARSRYSSGRRWTKRWRCRSRRERRASCKSPAALHFSSLASVWMKSNGINWMGRDVIGRLPLRQVCGHFEEIFGSPATGGGLQLNWMSRQMMDV